MESTTTPRTYSADVRLHLEVEGHVLSLAQTGPEHIIVRQPIDLPPCYADVVVNVDGREHRRHVRLSDGMSKDSRSVKINRQAS
jgi:hypothetical protein